MVMESRVIQGKGIFIIPEVAKKSRLAIIQTNVLQEPNNRSQNLKIQPYRAFYGWMTVMSNDRVEKQHQLMFPFEEVLRYSGEHAYLLTYLHCAVRNLNDNLFELFGATPVESYKPTWYQWNVDELRFILFNDTILEIRLIYEPIPFICDTINPIEQAQGDPGSSSPGNNFGDPGSPNPDSTPDNPNPGGIPLSQPYDPDTGDNGHSTNPPDEPVTTFLITMYGDANNQNNQRTPIDTFDYPTLWEFAPSTSEPFSLRKGIQFRSDLAEWDVVGSDGTVYGCGTFAWYDTPNFRVEPYG